MKHIYLNLKRFDVPTEFGGVNRIAPVAEWAELIVKNTQEELKKYDSSQVEFGMYFPEAHLLSAVKAKTEESPIKVGCQSFYRADTAVGGNFGAFTTNRPASAMVYAVIQSSGITITFAPFAAIFFARLIISVALYSQSATFTFGVPAPTFTNPSFISSSVLCAHLSHHYLHRFKIAFNSSMVNT